MNWAQRSKPQEIQPKPWLSDDAISYFQELLKPDMKVIEFGGGGSTLWLAPQVAEVVTVEHDEEWYDVIQKKAPENVTLCLAIVSVKPDFDLMFIDGEPVEERGWWLDNAGDYVKCGGYVVLDNANRPEYAGARAKFEKRARLLYSKTAGWKHLVTEFYEWLG